MFFSRYKCPLIIDNPIRANFNNPREILIYIGWMLDFNDYFEKFRDKITNDMLKNTEK